MLKPSDLVYFLCGVVAALLMGLLFLALDRRPAALPRTLDPLCEWKFIRYTPSPYEQYCC